MNFRRMVLATTGPSWSSPSDASQLTMLWATVASSAWEESDYPFVDELGRPYRPETLSRKFAKLTAETGLRPIRLHDTRHTAASLVLAAGEVPKAVAEILGHSSPAITVNVYQHLMPGMGEAAGARLTRLLAGTTG
jgi:integrase